jgi:hypothetical protein
MVDSEYVSALVVFGKADPLNLQLLQARARSGSRRFIADRVRRQNDFVCENENGLLPGVAGGGSGIDRHGDREETAND